VENDGVHTAFELILEELGSVSKELKEEAKALVDKGDFDAVSRLMQTGKELDDFQLKVKLMQNEWVNSFDESTRDKTQFTPVQTEGGTEDSLQLTMTYGEAYAEAEYLGRKVKLHTNSTIRKQTHESLADNIKEIKQRTLTDGDIKDDQNKELYRVVKPIVFNSPSGAAQFVAGCSVSGPREWQVKNQRSSLKYWLQRSR